LGGPSAPGGWDNYGDEVELVPTGVLACRFWFTNRDRFGLKSIWEYHGTYRQFATLDLLPSVVAVLQHHRKLCH
jgi:hypothetical protein